MRTTHFFARLALLLGLCAAPGCGPATAPEGFTLAIQLMHVNVSAVDSVRLTFAAVMEGTMLAHFVQPTRGTSFENGDIMISVDSVSGLLTMTITGSYFRAHALADDMGNDPRLEIEMWSDDTQMHGMPQVRATVTRAGNQIATGVTYLAGWPLPLGGTTTVNVPCVTGFEMQCAGM
jgi:hypothetical protein